MLQVSSTSQTAGLRGPAADHLSKQTGVGDELLSGLCHRCLIIPDHHCADQQGKEGNKGRASNHRKFC
ncbi:hypothetical protein OJAV_G00194450 [Oryzias javanicus]|uniref:Uncharacterized protein n=1 Tax=Oryzias javanicus TaxID=123683 RepID=A0A3S2MIR6_ORYJA|nr:hypothetical protein OJAV_G00194450 [Oryzias javanicus]